MFQCLLGVTGHSLVDPFLFRNTSPSGRFAGFELSESKILFLMDSNSNAVVDRNVFKRSIRAVGDENANAVKKPALVNPLQEVENAAPYREK